MLIAETKLPNKFCENIQWGHTNAKNSYKYHIMYFGGCVLMVAIMLLMSENRWGKCCNSPTD